MSGYKLTMVASSRSGISFDSDKASGRRRLRKKVTKDRKEPDESSKKIEEDLYDEYEDDEQIISLDPKSIASEYSLPSAVPTTSTLTAFNGDRKSKKMSAKAMERERLAAAYAEAQKARNLMLKELQDEVHWEKYESQKEVAREKYENIERQKQLQRTRIRVYNINESYKDYMWQNSETEAWARYLACDSLPDARILSDMNTFLRVWHDEDDECNMKTLPKRVEVVIFLLTELNSYINFTTITKPQYVAECRIIREQFRAKLQSTIDLASYRLLRHVENNMVRVDFKNANFVQQLNELICCVWALVRLPVTIKKVSEKEKKPIEVEFPEADLTITMPLDISCYCMAIRLLWLKYDHYSDQGTSYVMPVLPKGFRPIDDLEVYCQREFEKKMSIRIEQKPGRRLRLAEKKAKIEKLLNTPVAIPDDTGSKSSGKKKSKKVTKKNKGDAEPVPEREPLPYLPKPDEIIFMEEDEMRKEQRRLLFTRCEKTEVNLRKYFILGGVFHIDLIKQPPQPKDMRGDILLTTLHLPKELKFENFSRPYKAPIPDPDAERTPEVIEAELKALETAMDSLVLVTLKLPDKILWFEPPLVAHWISERKIWSTKDVHDIKYNEEKQSITFRTGKLGIHGLAANRFVNIPFQSWEMKPETGKHGGSGVVLSISAAVIQVEFLIREDMVCLHSITGAPSRALHCILGEFMQLELLVQRLRAGGCDLFPNLDASSYLKGIVSKNVVMQRHLQSCIGLLCTAYSFSWSRWNATRGAREIVIQMKEVHRCGSKEKSNARLLLVTPFSSSLVNCSEASAEFSDEPIDGGNFYSDLYHLALHNAGIKSRLLFQNISFKLAVTITNLLKRSNVLSLSS